MMSSSFETLKQGWYLIKVKLREELRAVTHLENQEFEAYCPQYLEKGRETILFPGYIFAHLTHKDMNRYHKIRSTRGVTTVVSFNQMRRKLFQEGHHKNTSEELQKLLPQPIPNGDKIIEQIEEMIWELNGCKPEQKPESIQFIEGEQVHYENPLFNNLRATFIKGINVDRGLILIQFINSQRKKDGTVEETVTSEKKISVPLRDLEKV